MYAISRKCDVAPLFIFSANFMERDFQRKLGWNMDVGYRACRYFWLSAPLYCT
jgi:hypothetical protein